MSSNWPQVLISSSGKLLLLFLCLTLHRRAVADAADAAGVADAAKAEDVTRISIGASEVEIQIR